MEIDLSTEFIISGHTYKEVRENLQAQVDAFLKGTKGTEVTVRIEPHIEEHSIAGFNQVSAWRCWVYIQQSLAKEKK